MAHRHHHHHRSHRRRRGMVWLAVLVACAAAVLALSSYLDRLSGGNSYGNVYTRFLSDITMEYGGKTYYYRENELINILVMGVDSEDIDAISDPKQGSGQADFLLILSLDRANKRITPVQIDRDTMAKFQVASAPVGGMMVIDGKRVMPAKSLVTGQICLAHAAGKTQKEACENQVDAVSRLLAGIPIDFYIAVDMTAIDAFNDALGGVEVTVEEDMTDIDPAFQEGSTLTLKGRQAEHFVRSRMAVKSDPTNAGRMRRQRVYMMSAVDKLTNKIDEDAAFMVRFTEQMGDHLQTNIPPTWMADNSKMFVRYVQGDIQTLAGQRMYGKGGFAEFYPDTDELAKMLINIFFNE